MPSLFFYLIRDRISFLWKDKIRKMEHGTYSPIIKPWNAPFWNVLSWDEIVRRLKQIPVESLAACTHNVAAPERIGRELCRAPLTAIRELPPQLWEVMNQVTRYWTGLSVTLLKKGRLGALDYIQSKLRYNLLDHSFILENKRRLKSLVQKLIQQEQWTTLLYLMCESQTAQTHFWYFPSSCELRDALLHEYDYKEVTLKEAIHACAKRCDPDGAYWSLETPPPTARITWSPNLPPPVPRVLDVLQIITSSSLQELEKLTPSDWQSLLCASGTHHYQLLRYLVLDGRLGVLQYLYCKCHLDLVRTALPVREQPLGTVYPCYRSKRAKGLVRELQERQLWHVLLFIRINMYQSYDSQFPPQQELEEAVRATSPNDTLRDAYEKLARDKDPDAQWWQKTPFPSCL